MVRDLSSYPRTMPPLDVRRPIAHLLPLVVASPHSGADYPPDFVAASRLDPLTLRRSEDSFVDEIFAAAPAARRAAARGAFPRAYLDVNREAYELDPTMFADALPDLRQRALAAGADGARHDRPGRRQRRGNLCRQAVLRRGASARIDALYQPYHAALRRLVDETEAEFGGCLLVDCHSMPSARGRAPTGATAPISCSAIATAPPARRRSSRRRARFLAERGFAVALNAPYAGGFTTGHYGQPRQRPPCACRSRSTARSTWTSAAIAANPVLTGSTDEMAGLIERLGEVAQDCLGAAA